MRKPSAIWAWGVLCVLAGLGGVLYAQEAAPTTPVDALLAEVRALRVDLTRIAGASIRTQLLVARLQLQEQRLLTTGRQLAQVQSTIADSREQIANEEAQVTRFESALPGVVNPDEQKQIQLELPMMKQRIDAARKRVQALQQQEADLLNTMGTDQALWSDFNSRLDALERSLPAGTR